MFSTRGKRLSVVMLLTLPIGAVDLSDSQKKSEMPVQGLRCEYLSNPSGIDVEKPRLSWSLSPAVNPERQVAYRVLVASSSSKLAKDEGDIWDSGRVPSAESTWVEYDGKRLASGQQAYWKVRIWTDTGKASPWSGEAHWSMGLLRPSAWHAKWIGERRPEEIARGTPLPSPWLRKTFVLKQKPARAVA